ncbi:hypothetical protein HS088_TW02G01098 [Tripterygium wilfordii]|uniref:Mitochondrial transcription termination factor family protein n=1 Tax=Tripterygium wilfordii TaxID=458696 RepID=A0A7J7E0F0_TRIWF|nr:transcription termination factor MTEF1, chloroplastic [Tripterygium wilfordii]KAF5752078.1 hypothetical protein HS088_TW02G01098 [Tripterygium wilfordii]
MMIIRQHLPCTCIISPTHPYSIKTPNCLPPNFITTTDSGLLFREKLLYLSNLKIDTDKALQLNPSLRSTPLSSLLALVDFFSSTTGLHGPSLGRILDMYPELLSLPDPASNLSPIFTFLRHEVPLRRSHLPKAISRCPRLLVSSVHRQLRPTLHFLRELGFKGPHSINAQTTMLLVSSVEQTLKPKIEYLTSLGFKYEEVRCMVVRSPGLLTFSVEKNLVPKVDYFFKEMKGDSEELKRFPQYFSFSLEGKIKPRHKLLIENGFSMPLYKMLKVSDGEFNARLIEMRLQLLEGR